jgi:hypothetical protein
MVEDEGLRRGLERNLVAMSSLVFPAGAISNLASGQFRTSRGSEHLRT